LGFEGDYNILNTGFGYVTIFHFSTLDFDFLTYNYAQLADEKNRERWNYFNKTPKSLANRKRKISALLLIVLAIIPTFIYESNPT
jgi:hypothetical protein